MKKLLIVMMILTGIAIAQSESRTDPGQIGTEVVETTTTTTTTEGGAVTEETQPQACMGGGGIMSFLPMIAIIAIFYFLMIRPQQKQAKQLKQMRGALQKDNRVVTSGGIHGVITNFKGDVVTVRIADGVKIDVDRNSLQMEGVSEDTSK
jgi:preprotein translocase subunit YajC